MSDTLCPGFGGSARFFFGAKGFTVTFLSHFYVLFIYACVLLWPRVLWRMRLPGTRATDVPGYEEHDYEQYDFHFGFQMNR